MILIVVGSSALGGSEVLALNLAQWMATVGIPCELVFLSSKEGPALRRAQGLGVPVHQIDESTMSRPRFVTSLYRLFGERSAHHVLAFMFGTHLYIAAAAKLAGASKVLAFVGNPAPSDDRSLKRMRRRARLAQPFTTFVVSCSEYVAQSIIPAYGLTRGKVKVVHNWCDVEAIAARSAEMRSTTQTAEVVGMIARMDPIKDHSALVHAFALIVDQRPRAFLRLAGDGPTGAAIAGLVAELGLTERVLIVGAIEDVAAELARLSVFAFTTTDQEGFGLVLAEAMAAGVPIVASDVGPVAEVLDGGRGGRLVPPDPDEIAREITAVLSDHEAASELSRSGRELVKERYSVELAGEKIMAILNGD